MRLRQPEGDKASCQWIPTSDRSLSDSPRDSACALLVLRYEPGECYARPSCGERHGRTPVGKRARCGRRGATEAPARTFGDIGRASRHSAR